MEENEYETIREGLKNYLYMSHVPEMWYGASTESWYRIIDGYFNHYCSINPNKKLPRNET